MILPIRIIASLVTLLGSVFNVASAQGAHLTVVTGTLRGADGRPMKLAHARLLRAHRRGAVVESVVGPDGRYALATTTTGAFYLDLTGVDHLGAMVPLVLQRPTTIDLDVQLRRYPYTDSLDRVVAIGDWNHFDFRTGRPMVKQSDGRYILEVEAPADTVAYQLLNLTPHRSINGTDAIRYAYDGTGDYRSVIWAEKGRATIVLDPRLLDRPPGEQRVTFRNPGSPTALLYKLTSMLDQWQKSYFDSSRAVASTGASVRFDFAPIVEEVTEQLARERDPLLRQILLCSRLPWAKRGAPLDSALAARIVREVPPSSLVWSFRDFGEPSDLAFAYARRSDARTTYDDARQDSAAVRSTLAYLDSVVALHPDRDVQADALSSAVFLAQGVEQREQANQYYVRLLAEYPDAPLIQVLKARFAPDRVLRVGASVPDFRFASLTDSTVALTRDAMLGKVYLLEFWAVWCKPCIDDMPYLHQAYDSLHTKGFQILSVSLDGDPADVSRFRAGQWRMPWLHAFARGGFRNPAVRQFEIVFIPRRALVDRDGKILAVDEELRGEKLMAILHRVVP